MQKKMFFILALPFVMAACGKSSSSSSTTCTNIAVTATAPAAESETLRAYLVQHPEFSTGMVKDTSGMYYIITAPGTGTVTPEYCSAVTVTYVGTVLNQSGPPFDQNTAGVSFYLRNLISGWQRGIPLIKKGGSIRLFIPPSLGYGSSGSGTTVPANAYLRFDINLQDVVN